MFMILFDAVGDAELSKQPTHLKMAMQVRRFNSHVIGLGQCFPIQVRSVLSLVYSFVLV